jgi:DNA (cytosine-5)-methyltransferase 1
MKKILETKDNKKIVKTIKVGTDFSGIGSPEAALKRLNIPHKNIFACDIDKYAKQSYLELNNPVNFYDDITTRNYKEVEQLDLYVAGFPCQSFSMAGKRGGFNDVRGTLFFNVAEFIKINKPKCFILENVKGLLSHDKGRTFQTIIDVLSNTGGSINGQISFDNIDDGLGYHIYYKVLNTKDYGIPQNRERIFIIGFKNWRKFRFPKKMPLNIKLKDILENNVDDKYFLSKKYIERLKRASNTTFSINKNIENETLKDYSRTITAGYYKGGRTDQLIVVHSLFPRSSKTGKGGSGHLSKKDGTSYCLDTGNNQAIEWIGDYRNDEGLRIRKDNNAPCLTATKNSETEISRMPPIIKQNKIRRLTPLECWRLQGFTDDEFYKAQKVNSDTQLYKQAGNSITINVMVEILKKIYLK